MDKARYIVSVFVVLLCVLISGCDKQDHNGDLYGHWQLLVWTGPEGDTLATKDSMIFYSFQLQMMRFHKTAGQKKIDMMSSFEKYPNAIRIYDPIKYKGNGHDSIYSMSALEMVGVPDDGVMNISNLTSDELVLQSVKQGKLVFRKY